MRSSSRSSPQARSDRKVDFILDYYFIHSLYFIPYSYKWIHLRLCRTECLKLLVAVTILTCATESERAELLNKWIEVAIDTKTALGNLFGFCSIMLGLCTSQVSLNYLRKVTKEVFKRFYSLSIILFFFTNIWNKTNRFTTDVTSRSILHFRNLCRYEYQRIRISIPKSSKFLNLPH